jgi:hypothetical protein
MKLTPEERQLIKDTENSLDNVLSQIDAARRFKIGDFLIGFNSNRGHYGGKPPKKELIVNSYGTPKKFQVVAVDKHDIPYVKELDKNSKPTGRLITTVQLGDDYHYNSSHYNDCIFEIDPDYADAIILDDTAEFKPAANHKLKADLFKEIAEYNKTIKIPMHESSDVLKYMLSLKVGDVIWKSNKSSLTVVKIDPHPMCSRAKFQRESDLAFIDAVNNKGQTVKLSISSLKWTAVYSARPRTYKELKD